MADQMTAPSFTPMSFGQIIDRTFSLYKQKFARFFTIVAVVQVPAFLLMFAIAFFFGMHAGQPPK